MSDTSTPDGEDTPTLAELPLDPDTGLPAIEELDDLEQRNEAAAEGWNPELSSETNADSTDEIDKGD